MPKSIMPASKSTRRKSRRISATGFFEPVTGDDEKDSSDNSSSSSSPDIRPTTRKTRSSRSSTDVDVARSMQSQQDGPSRRLRNRKSNDDNEDEEDRKLPATRRKRALTTDNNRGNTTTVPPKKTRLAVQTKSSSSSSSDEENDPAISQSKPLRLKKVTQVTPSPAATATANFDFQTPTHQRRFPVSHLPEGVLDLYPPASHEKPKFGQNDCSSDALTASFIQSYGQEYWTILKLTETPTIDDPDPPHSAKSSPASSQSSFDSVATPDQKRDYVYVDLQNLEVHQPMESTTPLSYQPELSPKMRAILVDWIIELSEHFHFGPASLHLAITLVDKVMQCGPMSKFYPEDETNSEDDESKTNCFFITRDRFQLLGAACTWLACKMEELTPPSVSEIAYVSDNIYSTEQIKRMERRICNALKFSLIHQTPYLYTTEFIRASYECPDPACMPKSSPIFYHMVMYLLELCRLPYKPVTQKPSLLAAAAVYAARVTLGISSADRSLDAEGRWSRTLQHYTGYSKEDLRETVLVLHSYHQAAEDSTLKSVFAKYRTKKYLRVAMKTVPRIQDLGY